MKLMKSDSVSTKIDDRIEAFLLDLSKVYKASSIYPSNHPTLLAMFVNPYKTISSILDEIDTLPLVYKRGEGFFVGEKKVVKMYPIIRDLGERLFRKKIHTVYFMKDIKLLELSQFINVVSSETVSDHNDQGEDKRDKDIQHIFFNEIDYRKLFKKQAEKSIEADEIEISVGNNGGTGEGIYNFLETEDISNPLDIQQIETGIEKGYNHSATEGSGREEDSLPSDIDDLIKLWKESRDYADFERIGNELINWAFAAALEKDGKTLTKVITAFIDVTELMNDGGFYKFASAGLDKMLSGMNSLEVLMEMACDITHDESSIDIIVRLNGRVAGYLADRLAKEENAHVRRILDNILVRMGKRIVPQLLERIDDERWYVVRNIVRVLGDIGEYGGVREALSSTIAHPDYRVRKETVRALAMMRGTGTNALLSNAVNDENRDVAESAVVSLGLIKYDDSVPVLIDLIESHKDNKLKKEAIKALGHIGSDKAVSFLINFLERKSSFFRTGIDDLKVECISVLADIGSPKAINAINAALKSSRTKVKKACQEALRRMQHG